MDKLKLIEAIPIEDLVESKVKALEKRILDLEYPPKSGPNEVEKAITPTEGGRKGE